MGRLTSKSIQKLAKEGKKGSTCDGQGLYLQVTARGSVSWIYRFKLQGKQHYMGLGAYPNVSLSDARDLASDNRKLVKQGTNPLDARHNNSREAIVPVTVISCAAQYIRAHRHSWRSTKHARQWISTLKTYVKPKLGKTAIADVSTQDVLEVLRPIWIIKNETAKRVQGRLENILDYASAHGYRDPVNPARWRGHLDKLLPRPSRVQIVKHHPAMPYAQVPEFMKEINEYSSISSKALQFLVLTATRTSEVLKSEWSEFDLENSTWIIPANRMKAKREHRVPLSMQAITILIQLPRIHNNQHVFPGMKHNCSLSNMALLQFMRGMGYGPVGKKGRFVPHGFRSSFRDWSGEVTNYPRDVAEMALAHTIENKVEAAYRRGDLFDKRREMMQEWADYISSSNSFTISTTN